MSQVEIIAALRSERLRRGMTLAEVGALVVMPLQQIHDWEFGNRSPRIDGLIRWAGVLGFAVKLETIEP